MTRRGENRRGLGVLPTAPAFSGCYRRGGRAGDGTAWQIRHEVAPWREETQYGSRRLGDVCRNAGTFGRRGTRPAPFSRPAVRAADNIYRFWGVQSGHAGRDHAPNAVYVGFFAPFAHVMRQLTVPLGAASLIVKADIWGLWRVSPHADRPAHEGLMPFRIRLCSWRSQGRMGFPTYRAYRTRKGNNDKGRREGRPLFVFFVCALTDPLVAGRAVLPKIQGFPRSWTPEIVR
jgi:hypothetical protein